MAIVRDKSGANPMDGSFFTHSRSNAGSPNAALTPAYVGEIVWDSTGKVRYKAIGLTNADWTALTTEESG